MNTTMRMSGLFFRVTTPLRCTSSGNCGCAIATRFCTSTCLVEIGAELEGDGDGELAVRGRLAVHVQHVLDAVDLLLDGSSDRVGNRLRRCARILRRHHNR